MSVVGHPFREVWFETVKSMYFHFTFTVPPDPQEYKWVLANCQGSLMIFGGVTLQWTSIPWGGGGRSSDTPSRLCYGNQDDF